VDSDSRTISDTKVLEQENARLTLIARQAKAAATEARASLADGRRALRRLRAEADPSAARDVARTFEEIDAALGSICQGRDPRDLRKRD
jgi:hypothetical protein